MSKEKDWFDARKKDTLLDELHIAITLRHAMIAHQLVDEAIGLGDTASAPDRVKDTHTFEERAEFQSTGALEGCLSMLSVSPLAKDEMKDGVKTQ